MVILMLFVVIGFLLGVAVVQGPLIFFRPQIERLCISLVDYGNTASSWALSEIATIDGTSKFISLLGPALGVMMPGIVALVLMSVSSLADQARRFASAIAVLAAFTGFLFLDFFTAFIILALAIALSLISSLASGVALKAPLAILVMVLAITYTSQMLSGVDPTLAFAVIEFSEAAGVGDQDLWRISLTALGVFPFIAAIWSVLKDNDRTS
jgi:hypothetical protein